MWFEIFVWELSHALFFALGKFENHPPQLCAGLNILFIRQYWQSWRPPPFLAMRYIHPPQTTGFSLRNCSPGHKVLPPVSVPVHHLGHVYDGISINGEGRPTPLPVRGESWGGQAEKPGGERAQSKVQVRTGHAFCFNSGRTARLSRTLRLGV